MSSPNHNGYYGYMRPQTPQTPQTPISNASSHRSVRVNPTPDIREYQPYEERPPEAQYPPIPPYGFPPLNRERDTSDSYLPEAYYRPNGSLSNPTSIAHAPGSGYRRAKELSLLAQYNSKDRDAHFFVEIPPSPFENGNRGPHEGPHTLIAEELRITNFPWPYGEPKLHSQTRQHIVRGILPIGELQKYIQKYYFSSPAPTRKLEARRRVVKAAEPSARGEGSDEINGHDNDEFDLRDAYGGPRRASTWSEYPDERPKGFGASSSLEAVLGSTTRRRNPSSISGRSYASEPTQKTKKRRHPTSSSYSDYSAVSAPPRVPGKSASTSSEGRGRRVEQLVSTEEASDEDRDDTKNQTELTGHMSPGYTNLSAGSSTLVNDSNKADGSQNSVDGYDAAENAAPRERTESAATLEFDLSAIELKLISTGSPSTRTASLPGLTRELGDHEFSISLAIPVSGRYICKTLAFDKQQCTDADIAAKIKAAFLAVRGPMQKFSLKGIVDIQIVKYSSRSHHPILEGTSCGDGASFRIYTHLKALASATRAHSIISSSTFWVEFFRLHRNDIDVRQVLKDGSIVDTKVTLARDEEFNESGLRLETGWLKTRVVIAALLPALLGLVVGVIWSLKTSVEAGFAIASYVLASFTLVLAAYALACSDIVGKK